MYLFLGVIGHVTMNMILGFEPWYIQHYFDLQITSVCSIPLPMAALMACAGYVMGKADPKYLSTVGIPSSGHRTPA
jgi:hypothetical protein